MSLVEKVASLSSLDPTVSVFAGGAFLRVGKKKMAETLFDRARKAGGDSAGIGSMINIVMSRDKGQ
jgi:hypothetical protein